MFKLMDVTPTVDAAQRELGRRGQTDRIYFTYRCDLCGRLITKIEVLEARSNARINLCLCGSRRIRPTNTSLFEELTKPRMWKMLYAMYTKRLAPPPPPPTPEEQAEADRAAKKAIAAFDKQLQESLGLPR